jgi:aconitate hydratase
MMRGTFANVRVKNLMLPPGPDGQPVEGGFTRWMLDGPDHGSTTTIFDAAMRYQAAGVPTVVFAGEEYGTGSSRDWAAKGTMLLGIKAVVAKSFERIHRSNLVGMGVLPLQFKPGDGWQALGLTGEEVVNILVDPALVPQSDATLVVTRADGSRLERPLTLRVDTPVEADYLRHGGILPYVLRQLLAD